MLTSAPARAVPLPPHVELQAVSDLRRSLVAERRDVAFAARLTPAIRRELAACALREGVSENWLLNSLLATALDERAAR